MKIKKKNNVNSLIKMRLGWIRFNYTIFSSLMNASGAEGSARDPEGKSKNFSLKIKKKNIFLIIFN